MTCYDTYNEVSTPSMAVLVVSSSGYPLKCAIHRVIAVLYSAAWGGEGQKPFLASPEIQVQWPPYPCMS